MLVFQTVVAADVLHKLFKHHVGIVSLKSKAHFYIVTIALLFLVVFTEELVIDRSCVGILTAKLNHFHDLSFLLVRCWVGELLLQLGLLFLFIVKLLYQVVGWVAAALTVEVGACRNFRPAHILLIVLKLLMMGVLLRSLLLLTCELAVYGFDVLGTGVNSLHKRLKLVLHEPKLLDVLIVLKSKS